MRQQQAIKTFFVTLRRSQIGKPWFHRQVLDGLGLRKRLLCVEKPNNPVIRGMLRQVAHLVVIETDQMYYNRKMAEYEAAKLRPPITVRHDLPPACAAGPALQEAAESSQQQPSV
eukprot:GHRQ01010271.1.p2 GENE.GHRQ01010271.1~~GHRQ01010271.1.p2  ORF type:complete len:115 (+),score=29.64 GHRQ01010271.1:258-602(+)